VIATELKGVILLWMQSQEIAEGGHIMWGMSGGMWLFGLLYVIVVAVFI